MLSKKDMHDYQITMSEFIQNNSHTGIWLDMGLGKTGIAISSISELFDDLNINKVLIIAPLRPAINTWPDELNLWEQSKNLTFKVLAGLPLKDRIKALKDTSDVHIINRENIPWLVGVVGKKWPYDCVIIDEAHSFKNPSSKRFKALKKMNPYIDRMIQLTGTPATNGLVGLWSQLYLLDRGDRLGKTFGIFKNTFFISDYMGYTLELRPGAEKDIHNKVKDICISMKAKDYLKLPKKIDNLIRIDLSPGVMKKYKELEKESILEIGDEVVEAEQAATLINKLLQCANGAVYHEDESYSVLHDAKLDAVSEIIENANGKPVLIAYNYISDKERLLNRFKDAYTLDDDNIVSKWNEGLVSILLVHPGSGGSGLNLQKGGNILCWFGPTWNLEFKLQMDARLHRQGQTESVVIHTIIAGDTAEELVIEALERKDITQESLLLALKSK